MPFREGGFFGLVESDMDMAGLTWGLEKVSGVDLVFSKGREIFLAPSVSADGRDKTGVSAGFLGLNG